MKGVNSKHRRYEKYLDAWEKCRVVSEGSETVKSYGSAYLPRLTDQRQEDYEAYKNRALFFEGTTRTVQGLVGMMFAKEPMITNEKKDDFIDKLMIGFETFKTFLKKVSTEVVTVGRCGVFVDMADEGDPYLVVYKAEDILNWRYANIQGKLRLTLLVLREELKSYSSFQEVSVEACRVLKIDTYTMIYSQELYIRKDPKDKSADSEWILVAGYPIFPQQTGRNLQEIPFYFINVNGNSPEPERPPLSGLVNVNLSHYVNSADLEHGRHFTGLPTPWVSGFDTNQSGKLKIGSQTAWVSSKVDAKAGYLEFTGSGLSTLENALKEKQEMMIILGARLLESSKKISESADNQTARKQGENSILANIADSVSDGITHAIGFAAEWSNLEPNDYKIEIYKDFAALNADAPLLSALMGAMQGGLISHDTFFYNAKRMGLVPDGRTFDTEKDMIEITAPPEHVI